LPISVAVGGENGHEQIICPTGYGAYQGSGYSVKCCKVGTTQCGQTNTGSPYCECVDSKGTCGEWINRSSRNPTCQIYT
jgi:hypothetical protein